MCMGDVFVLETQSEEFIPPPRTEYFKSRPKNPYLHDLAVGCVPQFSIVDIKGKLVLSISESGIGTLHTLCFINEAAGGDQVDYTNRQAGTHDKLKIEMQQVKAF